jgi:ubiquinone/menaquinone biosynthesis C-methylase UbiE
MPALAEAVGWEGVMSRNVEMADIYLADKDIDEVIRHVETLQMQRCQDASHQANHGVQAVTVTQKERNRARYHISGRWFQTKSTNIRVSDGIHLRSWALEFAKQPIPHDSDKRDVCEEFIFQIIRLKPRRLLDVASGGGFGVSRTLANLPDFEVALSVDRALDAIWIVQYKLKHIGVDRRADALGADVRALPLLDNTFDIVTCHHAMYEVWGITQMFREVYRVLQPGGHFVLSGNSQYPLFSTPLPDTLTPDELYRFLVATDLHPFDLSDLQSRIRKTGFKQVSLRQSEPGWFVAIFRKEAEGNGY